MSPVFIAALLPLGVGGVLFGVTLARHGGWAKTAQFRVLGELVRGVHGHRARGALFASLLLMLVGACMAFSGVAAGDHARARACHAHCRDAGYPRARIGPNSDRTDDRATWFVACICEGGTQPPSETRADALSR